MNPAGLRTTAMCIVDEIPDDFVGLESHQQACTCRPEYVRRKDGSRLDRQRIDPFCPCHGRHFRREIASAYCRAFNRRRFFGNFIIRLYDDSSDATLSWVKRYVTSAVRKYFDPDCIIKFVLHPDDENDHRHLHVGVASDVGYVTWEAITEVRSPRGRKPRLDIESAWIDGDRVGEPWNWSAYVLRVDEGWRPNEKVTGRLRRRWRSRAEKGQRIKAPTLSGGDEWYGAADLVPDDADVRDDTTEQMTTGETAGGAVSRQKPHSADVGLGWSLIPALRWKARFWFWFWWRRPTTLARNPRISTCVGGIQDGLVGARRDRSSRPRPQARPPPPSARPPPKINNANRRVEDTMSPTALATALLPANPWGARPRYCGKNCVRSHLQTSVQSSEEE
jgi:hypothetical protein